MLHSYHMKRAILLLIGILVFSSSPLFAQSIKIFQLKDGSSLKGQLVSFNQGIYVVSTQSMGEIQLKEADVAGIVEEGAQIAPGAVGQNPQVPTVASQPNFSSQMQQVQQQLLSDPQMSQQLQNLAQDPNITELLSDPQLVQEITAAVNSGSPQSIQQNPKVQQLMENDKMKQLIQQLQSSLKTPTPQNSSGQ